jgi:hypothetical protein
MFYFLKKIGKDKRKEFLLFNYDENGLYFALNTEYPDNNIFILYKNLFQDLIEDGLGSIKNQNELSIILEPLM